MIIACPHCQKRLEVDQHAVGSRVACPQCQQTFTIQGAGSSAPPGDSTPRRSRGALAVSPGFTRFLGKLGLGLGLVLVILARGCDSVGARSVDRLAAKETLAKNEFDQKWQAEERKLDKREREFSRKERKLREEERDAFEDASTNQERSRIADDFRSRRKALNEQQSDIREDREAVNDRKEKDAASKVEEWAELSNDSRNARSHNAMWSYWYAWVFLIGTVVLTLGLLGIGLTATGPERTICLVLLAVVAISLFFSQAGVNIRR